MSDWDAEDDDYPAAPIPPHERAWRHPSELSPMEMPTSRPLGRTTLVGAGVVGIALMAGLVQLLLPRSGGSGVATQATQSIRTPASGQSAAPPTVQFRQSTTVGPEPTGAPSSAAPTASVVMTLGMSAVPTLLLMSADRQTAVPIGDGRTALTTARHLSMNDTLEVQLDDGTSAHAVVVKIDMAANVAVLELTEPCGATSPVLSGDEPQRGDAVLVGANDAADGVLESTDSGMVVMMDSSPEEGSPVTDPAGALIGLASTDTDGTVHLVPIAQAIVIAYDNSTPLQVWLGVALHGEGLTVDSIQPASPADLAGVLPGDVLQVIGGSEIADVDQLWQVLSAFAPDAVTTVRVLRGTETLELEITLAARPS